MPPHGWASVLGRSFTYPNGAGDLTSWGLSYLEAVVRIRSVPEAGATSHKVPAKPRGFDW